MTQPPSLPDPYGQPYFEPYPPGPYPPATNLPAPAPASVSSYPISPYGYSYQQAAPAAPPMVVPMVVADSRPTSGMAVASMVLGIVGLALGCCSFGIFSILAVILGHVALHQTRDNTVKGHGMAVAGLVMGYILAAPAIFFSIWMVIGGGMAAIDPSASTTTY